MIIPQVPKNKNNHNVIETKIIPPPPDYTPPSPVKFNTAISFKTATPTTPVLITSSSNQRQMGQANGFAASMPNLTTASKPVPMPATSTPVVKSKSGLFGFGSKTKEPKDKSNKNETKYIRVKKAPKEPKTKTKPVPIAVPVPLPTPRNQTQEPDRVAVEAANPMFAKTVATKEPPAKVQQPVIQPITEITKPIFNTVKPQQTRTPVTPVVPAPKVQQIDTPITFGAVNIKPSPRTTGINYSTSTEEINDEIKIIAPKQVPPHRTMANKNNNNNNRDVDDGEVSEEDDIWHRVANRRNVRAVAFTLPSHHSKSTPSLVETSSADTNNTSLVIEPPKTLREMQRLQKLKADADRQKNQNTFKLAANANDEESDTEA